MLFGVLGGAVTSGVTFDFTGFKIFGPIGNTCLA